MFVRARMRIVIAALRSGTGPAVRDPGSWPEIFDRSRWNTCDEGPGGHGFRDDRVRRDHGVIADVRRDRRLRRDPHVVSDRELLIFQVLLAEPLVVIAE